MRNWNNIYTLLIGVCLLALTGCKDDVLITDVPNDMGSVVITMQVTNDATTTRAASAFAVQDGMLGSAEYVIDKLRVYVFASNGELDKVEIYDNLQADHVINQKIIVPKDASKELYFVANEPASMSNMLDVVNSAEQLKSLGYEIAEAMNHGFNNSADFLSDDFLIPMTATYSLKNATIDVGIHIALNRVVARLDLFLDKSTTASSREVELNSSSSFTVDGITTSSLLYEGTMIAPTEVESKTIVSSDVTLSTATADKSTSKRVLSIYMAERMYDSTDDDTKITVKIAGLVDNGVAIEDKQVTLGVSANMSSELTAINRNHVYRIYASYNGTEIVAKGFEIADWQTIEIDAEIEGVMLAVDNEVAMDWLRNGNSFTSKPIFFGSNKPISFYLPVSTGEEDELYTFQRFDFADMNAGKSYNLKDIALANNYIFTTNWIEDATIHFTSPQSGYIEFTYAPVKVNYTMQTYPIRIKSDNVVKQMKAVYDNGYIPSSLLSADWAERAPGGVIFAKRGEAKHPVSTPEIFYRDEDGYYRGEYSTTATDGTRYCTETFGEKWYMPSYADMIAIAAIYDNLGVSYRFQNNGSAAGAATLTEAIYWSSSASSEYEGSYWAADFMSREYMIEDFMSRREGTNTHFVRCVMDLQ